MKAIKIAILAAFLTPGIAWAADAPKGDAARGEKVFNTIGCWECHGVGGSIASGAGPRIAHTALTYDQFLHQLRQPAQEMAPFEASVVPDATAADIYAYLESLPVGPKAADLPLLMGMGVK